MVPLQEADGDARSVPKDAYSPSTAGSSVTVGTKAAALPLPPSMATVTLLASNDIASVLWSDGRTHRSMQLVKTSNKLFARARAPPAPSRSRLPPAAAASSGKAGRDGGWR